MPAAIRVDFAPQAPVTLVTAGGRTRAYGKGQTSAASLGAALESALSAASSGDGILLSGGTFTLTGNRSLPTGVSLRGLGAKQTIVNLAQYDLAIGSSLTIQDAQFLAGTVQGSGVNDVTIAQCEFDGTGNAATSDNLRIISDSYDVRIVDCTTRNATQHNVWVDACNRIQLRGLTSLDAASDNIHLLRGGNSSESGTPSSSSRWQTYIVSDFTSVGAGRFGLYDSASHDLRICNGIIENSTTSGIYLDTPIQVGIANCIIERNSSSGTVEAEIVVQLDNLANEGVPNFGGLVITGCDINQSEFKRGILFRGERASDYICTVNGNRFLSTSSVAFNSLLAIDGQHRTNYQFNIVNNEFVGTGGVATQKGVVLYHATTDTVAERVRVAGNIFRGLPIGVDLSRVSDVLVESNSFHNCTTGVSLSGTSSTNAKILRNRFRGVTSEAATANSATYVAIDNDGLADNP